MPPPVEAGAPIAPAAAAPAEEVPAPGAAVPPEALEEGAAPAELPTEAPATMEAPAPRTRAPKAAAPQAPAPRAAPPPAVAAEAQDLVMAGGSPFLRTMGFIQRADGERLPRFESVVVSKMLSHPLPTEPGAYEYRFKLRNGTGECELMQRTPQGAIKNKRKYEPHPTDAFQSYPFTVP